HEAMRPFSVGTALPNFIEPDEGVARLRASYGEEKYARLVALKQRWDPGNVFRLNQNIVPSAARAASREQPSPRRGTRLPDGRGLGRPRRPAGARLSRVLPHVAGHAASPRRGRLAGACPGPPRIR